MKKKKFSTTIDIVFSNADSNKKSKYSLEFNCLNKILNTFDIDTIHKYLSKKYSIKL